MPRGEGVIVVMIERARASWGKAESLGDRNVARTVARKAGKRLYGFMVCDYGMSLLVRLK